MVERFRQSPFVDRARAQVNLDLVERQLPDKLWKALPTLLAQVPDPDGALNYLERYLREDGRESLASTLRYIERNPAALHYLLVVFSYSRFLSETLVQQPELVEWLHRPSRARRSRGGIERVKSEEDLEEEFARFESTELDAEPARILARFKRREYLRITLRDVLGLATLADTTFEISQLADVLLHRALRLAEKGLDSFYGQPQYTDAQGRLQKAALTIFALGKLGGQELNYASDIDLMFLYDHDGQTSGGSRGSISNNEFFVRLGHATLKLIAEATPEGAVFRVDLRLRPQGNEGDITLSMPAALQYYRTRAREWELQMLIKARPAAGNFEAGRYFLREIHPLVFRPDFNLAAVEAVLAAREDMTRSLNQRTAVRRLGRFPAEDGTDAEWNVKLSPGGIRDIEFLTQCLQRLYGGTDSWLASPATAPTLVALQRLHDKGHLNGHDFHRLSAAYQFLRKVEHRLQLRDGLQRHALPGPDAQPPGALDRLARRCGVEAPHPAGRLLAEIGEHFADVSEIYNRLLLPRRTAPLPEEPAPDSLPHAAALLHRIAREFSGTARSARELTATSDAFARRGIDRFLTAAMLQSEVMQQIESHPEWLTRAAALFSRSDLGVEILARHCEDVALLGDASDFIPTSAPDKSHPSPEPALAQGRIAYRQKTFAALVHSALGQAEPFDTFAALTREAEWAMDFCLPHAMHAVELKADLTRAPFVVMALGRLGTHEMDFSSDADLVFVAADELTPQLREPWRRLAEQFIHVVSSHTREGTLFPVDTRLRPRGGEGEIVVSVSQLCDYLSADAHAWEAATWLKARPVAGNLDLGYEVVQRVRSALRARWGSAAAAAEMQQQLATLRERMEREGTGIQARNEFKHLPGSPYDIEYILSLRVFERGLVANSWVWDALRGNVAAQITALQDAGALEGSEARILASAAVLYRSVDHAHRVVTGQAANRMPEPALAKRLVALLNAWHVAVGDSPDSLAHALDEARRQVRDIYDRTFAKA